MFIWNLITILFGGIFAFLISQGEKKLAGRFLFGFIIWVIFGYAMVLIGIHPNVTD